MTALLTPRKYVIGLGCRKGSCAEILKRFVEQRLFVAGISPEDIFKICSIDLKAEESAILDLAREFHRPFVVFSAEQLNRIEGEFSASSFVETVTGTDNVCERSALAGCVPWNGKLILRKYAEHGMTIAIAERILSSQTEKSI